MEYKLNNFINQLKMAISSNFDYVSVPSTKMVGSVLKILLDAGFINSYTLFSNNFVVSLKYLNNRPTLRQLFLMSRPSSRIHFGWKNTKLSNTNNGIYSNAFIICTTSKGLLTDLECVMLHIGGQPLLYIA